MLTVHQLKAAAVKPMAALPVETHRSFPVPVRTAGRAAVAFFFSPGMFRLGEGILLSPPEYVLELAPDHGRLLSMEAVTPADFQQAHQPGKTMGVWRLFPGRQVAPEVPGKLKALDACYDVLLPAFFQSTRATPVIMESAQEFLQLFPELSEPPLMPYYQQLGKAFFSWLQEVAQ